jgi:predicted MFS family arabinose efflux permease
VGVLFGLITLSHQLGAGLSAWLSGYIYDVTGSYDLAFALAAYLCLQAAVIVFFINEKETRRPLAAAAPEPA